MLTGLRGRTALAMALVSAITLGVTAVLLFSPLQHRLRDDVLDGMEQAVRADRLAFARLNETPLVPTSPALHEVVRSLHRGSGADVTIVGSGGRVLTSTDRDADAVSARARAALRTGAVQRGETGSADEPEAEVAVPVTLDGNRIAVVLDRSLDGAQRGVRVVRDAFLIAAGISLLVALLVGALLSARLARRLRALRDTALRVSALGPVAEIRSDDARDEVGDLTRALAVMQDRLREQERARGAFVTTASHELRTPLASLTVLLDTVRRDLEGPAPDVAGARDSAARAEAQAERVSVLAGELLDLSRIDAGLGLREEPVQLPEVVDAVVADFADRAAAAGRRVDVAGVRAATARADPGSVARILGILLDNALRHAPDGPVVEVTTAARADGAELRVRDHGPGVPPGERDAIFGRFARGDATTTPGFGLGLAIARELARSMHGDLVVGAPADGAGGAVFVLSLPRGDADGA